MNTEFLFIILLGYKSSDINSTIVKSFEWLKRRTALNLHRSTLSIVAEGVHRKQIQTQTNKQCASNGLKSIRLSSDDLLTIFSEIDDLVPCLSAFRLVVLIFSLENLLRVSNLIYRFKERKKQKESRKQKVFILFLSNIYFHITKKEFYLTLHCVELWTVSMCFFCASETQMWIDFVGSIELAVTITPFSR